MTVKPPAPPPLPDELDRLLRRLRMPYVRRAAPEVIATADQPALGTRRSPPSAARRGGRRPRPGDDPRCAAARPGCRPARRSTPGSPSASVIPKPTQQALQTLEWVNRAEVLVVCGPSGKRQVAFHRSARSPRDRQRPHRRLAHARDPRRPVPPPPRRRQRQQGDRQTDPLDLILIDDVGLLPVSADAADALFRVVDAAYEKRSIAISSNIHPSGFDELMPKTPRDRDRRPTPASRARDHHRRPGQLPARASDRRQRGEAPDLNPDPAPAGEKRWPRVGRSDGHQRGEMMATSGEFRGRQWGETDGH